MSSPRDRAGDELTQTSFVLLALMNLRPWSAYAMVEQMGRGMQFIWPRAERAFYYEAKSLAAGGYAKATAERDGGRRRTVYTITGKGRRALERWLASDDIKPPEIESEALLRIFFAETGGIETVRAGAESLREYGRGIVELARRQANHYLTDGGPFPQRNHLIALAGVWLYDYGMLLYRYGTFVRDEVAGWSGVGTADEVPQWRAVLERVRDAPMPD